eukprot:1148616-Pelagomonas_calceolata.AAC.5
MVLQEGSGPRRMGPPAYRWRVPRGAGWGERHSAGQPSGVRRHVTRVSGGVEVVAGKDVPDSVLAKKIPPAFAMLVLVLEDGGDDGGDVGGAKGNVRRVADLQGKRAVAQGFCACVHAERACRSRAAASLLGERWAQAVQEGAVGSGVRYLAIVQLHASLNWLCGRELLLRCGLLFLGTGLLARAGRGVRGGLEEMGVVFEDVRAHLSAVAKEEAV